MSRRLRLESEVGMKRIICLILHCIIVFSFITACGRREPDEDEDEQYETQWVNGAGVPVGSHTEAKEVVIYENLALLGKVWGFAKYHHPMFLTGQLCWDAELLRLVPYVLDGRNVRGILYEWFVGLDENGCGLPYGVYFDLENLLHETRGKIASLEPRIDSLSPDMLDLLYEFREFVEYFAEIAERENGLGWHEFVYKIENGFPRMAQLILLDEEGLRPMAYLSWISYENLGPLAEYMQWLKEIRVVGRREAPIHIDFYTDIPDFYNQPRHQAASMSLPGNRLLGLFRLWNAIKYFFPHLDALDTNWNDLLLEFIPKMLEGEDRPSYELTLAAFAHHLRDAHVNFLGTSYFSHMFGQNFYYVQLVSAEGQLVVYDVEMREASASPLVLFDGGFVYRSGNARLAPSPLARGDVVIAVNGRDIDEVTSEMRRFLSYPSEEKALAYLVRHRIRYVSPMGISNVRTSQGVPIQFMRPGIPHVLTAHENNMYIDVLRGRIGMIHRVSGWPLQWLSAMYTVESHVLLEGGNIGLINPGVQADVHYIMESFADAYGIIIDLRQQPHACFMPAMLQYVLEKPVTYMYLTKPSHFNPGKRITVPRTHKIPQNPYAFIFDRPVVLLIDIRTIGATERVVMSLFAAPNVTVIGPYSMGSGGEVAVLPLPGGIDMFFTSLGVYTPAGGQTFRVGITPDIRVDRTIQGITDGRDEIMEAAIQFILGER